MATNMDMVTLMDMDMAAMLGLNLIRSLRIVLNPMTPLQDLQVDIELLRIRCSQWMTRSSSSRSRHRPP
jgi:hypothetical protein